MYSIEGAGCYYRVSDNSCLFEASENLHPC
jgi:hypothetical protein